MLRNRAKVQKFGNKKNTKIRGRAPESFGDMN
jgi:hypothetical protein